MPLSTNALYAHVGRNRFLTSKARDNKDAMAWEVRMQYKGKPLEGPLELEINLYWPNKRKHDLDNSLKALLDSLTGIVWIDDSQVVRISIEKFYDKNARVAVKVIPHE